MAHIILQAILEIIMVNDDTNKKLPVLNIFWEKLRDYLLNSSITVYDLEVLIEEHKRNDAIIPPEIMAEFVDVVMAIHEKTLHPLMADMLFKLLIKKYREE
ncbi:MAG: hypothetical protein ABRQ39_21305 [Candidatus Eremiobacterota bacterium]